MPAGCIPNGVDITIGTADFNIEYESDRLSGGGEAGAVATFIGYVRSDNDGAGIAAMELEHYPGMTEKAIAAIVEEAGRRFSLLGVRVIHRVGRLHPGDRIVFVGVASAHRGDAFAACEMIMDFLKTQAPIWKKELTDAGASWVDARGSDDAAVARWRG